MQYRCLRLRFSSFCILIILIILFLTTFYTTIWSTNELEQHGSNTDASFKHGDDVWSAVQHHNIYDFYAVPPKIFTPRSSITPRRIEELNQLVHNARTDDAQLSDYKRLYPLDPKWDFTRLVAERQTLEFEFANESYSDTHTDIVDLAGKSTTATTPSPSTTPVKPLSEHDKIQLRNHVHRAMGNWKQKHKDDKIITAADLMHDELARTDAARLNTSWYEYMKTVNNLRVYDPNQPELKALLKHLQTSEIIDASEMPQGSQIKIVFRLPGGFEGLFKPYRVSRNYQTLPDHFYFDDIERHYAEIAAFHLDKILGFYRIPPVIGRKIHMTRDIREKATENLAKTFFTSPANNTCFRGYYSHYCDTTHAVCGKPGDRLEGSVQLLLPRSEIEWVKIVHPYRRSYSPTEKAKWETNENYCYERVFMDDEYHNRLIMDMMDLSAFDFLTGNQDRHHVTRFGTFGDNTALIHLDNGRSFGRYDFDDLSILTPIRHCCLFRYSTFSRLYRVYRQGLSILLSRSLEQGEQLPKILIDEHLTAVDRRLEIIFEHLETCIKTYTVKRVMVDDGID